MKWPAKKTDKLEVRLSTETKQAFLARCRSEGRSASEAVRVFIDDHLARSLSRKDIKMIVRSPFTYAGLTAALIAGALVFTAQPSRAEPDFAAIFKSLDTDGNGRLNAAEFDSKTGPAPAPSKANEGQASLSAGFAEIDTNQDAAVSLPEFVAFNRASITRRFLALDANSDGKITLAELQKQGALLGQPASGFAISGAPEGFFRRFDANSDGSITEQEFAALP